MFPGKVQFWWCSLVMSIGVILACDFKLPNYTERKNGNMNLMLLAVHGGKVRPSIQSNGDPWPTRQSGCYINGSCVWNHDCVSEDNTECTVKTSDDAYTRQVAKHLRSKIKKFTGHIPAVIVSTLRRNKLDANKEIGEATFNVPDAITAYNDLHGCVTMVRDQMNLTGRGLILDIDGYDSSYGVSWVDLGYGITPSRLNTGEYWPTVSSIESLGKSECPNDDSTNWETSTCFKNMIKGDASLGEYFNRYNYTTVPSPGDPSPGTKKYFVGGYNTKTYGSWGGNGQIDAIQIELPYHIRQSFKNVYADSFAKAIICYFKEHYDPSLPTNGFSCLISSKKNNELSDRL